MSMSKLFHFSGENLHVVQNALYFGCLYSTYFLVVARQGLRSGLTLCPFVTGFQAGQMTTNFTDDKIF